MKGSDRLRSACASLAVACALTVSGCGSGVGGTTLAEAREYCDQEWEPMSDAEWDAVAITLGAFRDEGLTKAHGSLFLARNVRTNRPTNNRTSVLFVFRK